MAVTEGLRITELDSLVDQDGTELFLLVIDASGTPVNRKVVGDLLPLRGQPMFTVPGTLSVDTDPAPWYICSVPGGLQLLNTALAAKTASTGADLIVDIEVSNDGAVTWTSIYSVRPTLPAGDRFIEETGTLSITHIDQGNLLRIATDQVGSTVAGADLTASLWTRQGGTGIEAATTSTSTTTLTSTSTSSSTTTSLAWQSPSSVHSACGFYPGQEPSYIIDGNLGSSWIHLANEDHVIVFDLGESKTVEKIRLYVYDQLPSQWCFFQAYLSDDLEDWGSPVVLSGSFQGGEYGAEWVEQAFTAAKTGRYLWLTLIDTEDSLDHIMGAELEVYVS